MNFTAVMLKNYGVTIKGGDRRKAEETIFHHQLSLLTQ